MREKKLAFALPTGSLQERTLEYFGKAEYEVNLPDPRSYHPSLGDPKIECTLLRAQEIPEYVHDGEFDAGITGSDWVEEVKLRIGSDMQRWRETVEETNRDIQYLRKLCPRGGWTLLDVLEWTWKVRNVAEFFYSKQGGKNSRLILAVRKDSAIQSLAGSTFHRGIATELPYLTGKYLQEYGVNARVQQSYGATEAKGRRLYDGVVTVSDSGATLKANGLRELAVVFVSRPVLIANVQSWKDAWKRVKILEIATRLLKVVDGELLVGGESASSGDI